jgi:hypothetical protein
LLSLLLFDLKLKMDRFFLCYFQNGSLLSIIGYGLFLLTPNTVGILPYPDSQPWTTVDKRGQECRGKAAVSTPGPRGRRVDSVGGSGLDPLRGSQSARQRTPARLEKKKREKRKKKKASA